MSWWSSICRRLVVKVRWSRQTRPISATSRRPRGDLKPGFPAISVRLRLVERGGEVRTFHVPAAHLHFVVDIVEKNIARESRLHTDESKLYDRVGKQFAAHETVTHSDYEHVCVVT